MYDGREHLALAEGQAGVDVLTVNPLQEGAAPVQRRLLPPRLKVAEQLAVHLRVRRRRLASNGKTQGGVTLYRSAPPLCTPARWAAWLTGRAASPGWPTRCSCSCCGPS